MSWQFNNSLFIFLNEGEGGPHLKKGSGLTSTPLSGSNIDKSFRIPEEKIDPFPSLRGGRIQDTGEMQVMG